MREQAKVNVPRNGILSFFVGTNQVELDVVPNADGTTSIGIRAVGKIKALRVMQNLPLAEATSTLPISAAPPRVPRASAG